MEPTDSPRRAVRFGAFEVDVRAGELRRSGVRIKLQEQPFQVLVRLLERPGQVVTREELRHSLWPEDTFVDFDHSLNTAVNRLREALGDSADSPRFVETLPRRGYRFIAPLAPPVAGLEVVDGARPVALVSVASHARAWGVRAAVLAAVVLLAVAGYLAWRRAAPPAAEPGQRLMLAVLPFENLSGDPEQEYFSDGLTEEMITQLGQLQPKRLGVIARTSSFHYKGTNKSIEEIGGELGVDYILEGAVRREGERVRVSAQLIQVSDQSHLWTESYDRELSGILGLQGELARAIAREIRLTLSPRTTAQLASARQVNLEAFDAYLLGRHYARQSAMGWKSAEYYLRAIEKDPNYAPAFAGLAEQAAFALPASKYMPRARAAATKALQLDEKLSEAHMALGLVKLFYDWDWTGAESEFKRAIELDPGSSLGHHRYTHYLWAMGRPEEALAEARLAQQLDPRSLLSNLNLGRTYYFVRDYDKAIEQHQKTLALDPNYYWAHFFLGITYEQKGMHKEAIAEIVKARELAGDPALASAMSKAYATSGYQGALRTWAEDWAEDVERGEMVQPSSVAMIYSRLGEKEKALEWLEKAFQQRARGLVYVRVEPQLDPLRSDPRFQNLLRRMDFPN